MRAHWHIRRFTREDMAEARRLLQEAIEIDPANAMALGDLSIAHHFAACFGWDEDAVQTYARAGDAARRAVAIDDGDAHAHAALAMYDVFQGRHDEGRRRLRRALDLDPNSAFVNGYLGVSYGFAGDYDTALPILDHAIRLSPRDPLLTIWHLCKGWAAFNRNVIGRLSNSRRPLSRLIVSFLTYTLCWRPHTAISAMLPRQGSIGRVSAANAGGDGFRERLNRPFGTPAQREHFLDGLRRAGLPEE